MRRKKISIIVLLVMSTLLVLSMLVGFAGCNNVSKSLDMSYMEGLTFDLTQVKGLAINKTNTGEATSCSDNDSDDNYIYYTDGDIEYDERSIKKVTFKKNTAKTRKYIGPSGKEITNDTIIKQEDIPAKLNRMFVSGKYMFMQYILPYKNSDLVCTFNDKKNIYGQNMERIHYHSDAQSKEQNEDYARPETLVYNEKGESLFDKTADYVSCRNRIYYSNFCSQSFVMDLTTGYIYKIEGISIKEIDDDGLVLAYKDSDYDKFGNLDYDSKANYYKLEINDKSELEFSRLIPNDNVRVEEPFRDKFGYIIVPNDTFNEVNKENKIIYTGLLDNKELDYCKSTGLFIYDNFNKVYIDGECKNIYDDKITIDYKYYKGTRVGDFINVGRVTQYEFGSDIALYYSWMIDWNTIVCEHDGYLYYKKIDIEELYHYYLINNHARIIEINDMIKLFDNKVGKFQDDYNKKPYLKKISNNQLMIAKDIYTIESLYGTKYYTIEMENDIPVLKLIEDVTYQNNKFVFQPINK